MHGTRTLIRALHKRGLLNSKIAEVLGISRQYVSEVLKRPVKPKPVGKPKWRLGESLVTPIVLAQALGIHVNTVRQWADRGILPCIRIGPREDRRFRIADLPAKYASLVRRWLDGQK
jgi:hypothetical protein